MGGDTSLENIVVLNGVSKNCLKSTSQTPMVSSEVFTDRDTTFALPPTSPVSPSTGLPTVSPIVFRRCPCTTF